MEVGATKLDTEGMKPIYMQIAEWLETEILCDNIQGDEKIYSQYQLAEMFNINPATAAKGLNILADENILYKRRGIGMFVAPGAKQNILKKRKNETLKNMVLELVLEAKRLQVGEDELIKMIKNFNKQSGGNG